MQKTGFKIEKPSQISLLLGTLLFIALLASSCVSYGSGGTTYGAPAGAPASTNSTQQGNTATVTMAKSYRFDPASIEVPVGTTVTWVNDDNFTHDVRFTSGLTWQSQPLKPGDSVSYTFTTAGDYTYDCSFHSTAMKGKVTVVQP